VGRNAKLDEARLEALIAALELGLNERDAAESAGISKVTLYAWKARARAASEVLPDDWPSLKFEELRACAEELEIKLANVPHSGRNGRLTREDVIRELRTRAAVYVNFLNRLEAAGPNSKRALLQIADDLANGRVKMQRTRTTQTVRTVNGVPEVVGDTLVMTEVLKLPPDRQATFKMLEMRWPEEFSPRTRGAGGMGAKGDTNDSAREVHDAVYRMLSTVPPPPAGLLPEAAGGDNGGESEE
jgi:transposase